MGRLSRLNIDTTFNLLGCWWRRCRYCWCRSRGEGEGGVKGEDEEGEGQGQT